jgi:hypothetical protein
MTCGSILFTQASVAQTTIQLFGPVNVGPSLGSTTYSIPYAFNTNTLNLTCPTSGIQATLSGPAASGGNLLVDNNIIVTVTPVGNGLATPANVCPANGASTTGQGLYNENCFSVTYQGAASGLTGQNPDTYLLTNNGGVAPIDISPYLSTSGTPQNVTIALTDEGGDFASSTVILTTNCTQGPVTGPAQVSGNPITGGGTPQGLTQTFTFNSNTGNNQQPPQVISFVYDVSGANTAGTLSQNSSGSTPITGDMPVDPATFQSFYVPQTSFATSNCLIHTGEALPSGNPACKIYTLECVDSAHTSVAGANCPVSTLENEVVKDLFDGPAFSLPNIYTKGDVFREGIGFLMSSDGWGTTLPGGPCTFDVNSGLVTLPCPQNLLTSFSGPGAFSGKGLTTNPNSTFISIYGVPEDLTSVFVSGEWPDHWVNTSTPKVSFNSEAPDFTKGAFIPSGNKLAPLPGAANYIPAPIHSITYGISAAGNVPLPVNEPITADTTLVSTANCAAIPFTAKTVPNFVPPAQTLPSLPDGQYLLHYYAQDCAGTQELLFTQDQSASWSTNFYTRELNVDTTPPSITGLTLTPAAASYKVNSVVNASYTCTDLNTGAGVVLCGLNVYAPESNYNTGILKTKLNTSSTGLKTFVVSAVDGAGNITTKSTNYTVTK